MKRKMIGFAILNLFAFTVNAQPVLEKYIDSALAGNIVLKQKNIALQKAEYALNIAKGMYSPNIEFQGQYTTASGGRNIDLPIGDMLNNVYSTLNQLTQTNKFPQLENQSINFLPQNFYDARVHTTIPIYNAQLNYNKKITAQQIVLNEEEIAIYKRDLVEQVKNAYYNYLQTLDAINIYQSALELATEGKRVNEKLLKNGKGLPAYVLRSESEMANIQAKITEVTQNSDNARRYFNFLLNRDEGAPIDTPEKNYDASGKVASALQAAPDISNREELNVLTNVIGLKENVYKMNKSVLSPSVNGFLDLGSQSENWKFNNQSRYFLAGVQVNFPIFQGQRNKYKIKQATLDIENAKLEKTNALEQLTLNSHVAQNNLRAAYQNYASSKQQLETAETYQRLIERGFLAGTNSYIETIDARNQLTQAMMQVSINRLKMFSALAKLERATASYTIQ
jgi:outer membrane protein TolC